jgi:hypothetical protein
MGVAARLAHGRDERRPRAVDGAADRCSDNDVSGDTVRFGLAIRLATYLYEHAGRVTG